MSTTDSNTPPQKLNPQFDSEWVNREAERRGVTSEYAKTDGSFEKLWLGYDDGESINDIIDQLDDEDYPYHVDDAWFGCDPRVDQ